MKITKSDLKELIQECLQESYSLSAMPDSNGKYSKIKTTDTPSKNIIPETDEIWRKPGGNSKGVKILEILKDKTGDEVIKYRDLRDIDTDRYDVKIKLNKFIKEFKKVK